MQWLDHWVIVRCRKTFHRFVGNLDLNKLATIEKVLKTGKRHGILTYEAALDDLYRLAKRYDLAFNDTVPTEYLLKPVRRAIEQRLRQL